MEINHLAKWKLIITILQFYWRKFIIIEQHWTVIQGYGEVLKKMIDQNNDRYPVKYLLLNELKEAYVVDWELTND